ncbi:hypothetical protein BCR35DRAFT_297893 [Leucosporidium creatinivorum]|uniref:Insulin-like growth factor binding protein n=1 Tax=Leucosporidium creatinivorum TaxID=106004 RepID=A0A1Y2G4M0_9BASI|nr:hypothetical protein BCR35DRAFT_297893 [Leucosporidium creatinivorum]
MIRSLFANALLLAASTQALPTSLEERAIGVARTCPTGQYFLNSKCVPCTSTFDDAATCNSAGALTCSTKFLNPTTKRCVAVCPEGFYGKDHVCSPCSGRWLGSSTCTATGATGCRSPRFLTDGKCVTACPAGTFGAETGSRACTPCSKVDFHAATCSATEALSCEFRTKLYKGKCLGSCPSATFADSTGKVCTDCPANALTCTSSTVLTCATGYTPSENTCKVAETTSIAFYRIPGVAFSGASFFDFSSTDAKTERQCVDFCATHQADGADYDFTFRLTPELCTCSNTIIYAQTHKVVGTVSLTNAAYANTCSDPRLNLYGVCELVEYRGETCYVKGTNNLCAADPGLQTS